MSKKPVRAGKKRRTIPSTVTTTTLRKLNTIGATAFGRGGVEINHKYQVLAESGSGLMPKVVFSNPDNFSQKVLVSQISQGSGTGNRVGRLLKWRSMVFRYTVVAPPDGQGGSVRMVIVFDKRPERSQSLGFNDIFTVAGGTLAGWTMLNALPRESSDGRFEFLYDKTVRVDGARDNSALNGGFSSADTGTCTNAKSGMEIIDLTAAKYYTQYTVGGTSGNEGDIEYGSLHFIYWSEITAENIVSTGQQAPGLHAYSELRWTDN